MAANIEHEHTWKLLGYKDRPKYTLKCFGGAIWHCAECGVLEECVLVRSNDYPASYQTIPEFIGPLRQATPAEEGIAR